MSLETGPPHTPVLREVTRPSDRRDRQARPRSDWVARGASLGVLGGLTAGLVALVWTVAGLVTDAWVGPAHLSPDSDQVLSLRLRVNQQLAEMARVEAEVVRIDGELAAIDQAIERLRALRSRPVETLAWTADAEARVADVLQTSERSLRSQIETLEALRARQAAVAQEAEAAAAAGLETEASVERERTALMRLDVSLAESRRRLHEIRAQGRASRERAEALRAGTSKEVAGSAGPEHGALPEVAAREEQEIRLELELVGLEAERRGLAALRRAAVEGLDRTKALLAETKARPLYRAMEAATDVAFVPYDHLEAVEPGHRVMQCVWGVFWCWEVGRVAEVLSGEVVTQDPWGELARGRYAILDLDDPEAIQERTLRVRGP